MNRMALIMICLVLVFSMVSCDDQGEAVGYGSLSVEVSNGDGSKTIRPTDESLAFASYRIEGRHRTIEGRTVDETFTDGNIEIDRLETGEWEFMVEGLNKDKVVLAKSEAHIVTIKTNGTAKETYTLDWIEGHGTLELSVKVQTSRVSTIECKLYDKDGNDAGTCVMTKDDSKHDDEEFLVFEHSFSNVPTGSYDATITMKDKDNGVIGRALHPSVHVHDGLVSSYGFSWENFRNLLPNVDAPKVTNIGESETTVSCDSTILFGTEENGTTLFYSLDGKTYSKYQEGAIDLSTMGNLNDSIAIWTYAEKASLNKSDVVEYKLNIEHNSPDRANAVYTWNATEGGYECIATSKCLYHKNIECEAEKAVASYQVITDSTCSKEGVGRYTAKFAKDGYKVQTKDEAIAKRHIFDRVVAEDKYLKSSATCLESAVYYKSCECGRPSSEEYFSFGNPLGHNLVHHEAKAATCTGIGWNEYDTCSRCSYTTYEEIPALGHELEHHEAKDPTCTEIGWSAYDTCTRCEFTTYNEIGALGHDKVHHEAKAVTCTEIGWDEYDTCTRCEYTTYEEIDALGHDYVRTETKSPTCIDTGMYEHVCSRCNHTKYEEIPALGHDLEQHDAKAATCTEVGWSLYDTCTRCDYTTYEEIDVLGHNYLLSRVDDEYHGWVCSRCKNAIDKEHHSFKDYKCETCGVWGRGPSGGYVFYDRGAYTEGVHSWRYLEAAPADLRLVDGVPTVDSTKTGYSNGTYYFVFGYYRENSDGSNVLLSTRIGIGVGYNNTDILVGKMQDTAYTSSSGTGTTSSYAARLCDVLEYEVNGEEFNDWFLPSQNELSFMYSNLHEQGLGSFAGSSYWSSSEDYADDAWTQDFDGGTRCHSRHSEYRVRPVRAF